MIHPTIIQGGMGAGVSGWRLARAVASRGELGVVSSTALDVVAARRLQLGDLDGSLRRAFGHFPFPAMAERVLRRYFRPEGKPADQPFRPVPKFSARPRSGLVELTVLANFAEVFLAREGHGGRVGINLLEKIQLPILPSLFGAMLAGVDYVLMGAGIPRAIPGVLDAFAAGRAASLRLDVEGAGPGMEIEATLDPAAFCGMPAPLLPRPHFLAVVSSATLAMTLARRSNGRVDGFVVEGPSAGGHNAPPRGVLRLDGRGEPIYGERDVPDREKIRALGLPFWLAGSYGRPGGLSEARRVGATGVQVGTPFAFCEESGIEATLKRRVIDAVRAGRAEVFTDPFASPTGFPFKVLRLPGTVSERSVQLGREPVCDLGYLRRLYRREDGTVGGRCPGEPVAAYLRKGGDPAEIGGRKCVCNGLLATIGLAQVRRDGAIEPPLITAGDGVRGIVEFLPAGADTYTAADVIERLRS